MALANGDARFLQYALTKCTQFENTLCDGWDSQDRGSHNHALFDEEMLKKDKGPHLMPQWHIEIIVLGVRFLLSWHSLR